MLVWFAEGTLDGEDWLVLVLLLVASLLFVLVVFLPWLRAILRNRR